jgi:hypothetical protein
VSGSFPSAVANEVESTGNATTFVRILDRAYERHPVFYKPDVDFLSDERP